MKTAIDIGIPEKHRKAIGKGLSRLIADTYTLYLQTRNFHWNVTGPMFQTLHLMFETHYTEMAMAVDQIAERIRPLGVPAPGTYGDFARLSSIAEVAGLPKAKEMIGLSVLGNPDKVCVNLNSKEAARYLREHPETQVLDVRSDGEFSGGALPGAMNVSLGDAAFGEKAGTLDRSRPVLVYCAGGFRSRKAVEKLKTMGFENIQHLRRGYMSWNPDKTP